MSHSRDPRIRLTPEALDEPGRFLLVKEVAHEDLVPTVQALLKQPSPVKAAYVLVNTAAFAALTFLWARSGVPFFVGFPNLALGMCLGYIVLLPIHESLHALTYRRLGARGTRIFYNLRNLTACCVADRFVISGRQFAWVCLVPFLVLNTLLAGTIVLLGGFRPILWGMLLLHIGACSGDFAFVNLAWAHRKHGLLTYDDVAGKKTLFYTARPQGPMES